MVHPRSNQLPNRTLQKEIPRFPSQPHYRPADYLEQTGLAGQTGSVPASLWDALLAHARREDLPQLAVHAQMRSLYRYAFHLYVAAADAGDTDALEAAARMLEETGRTEEAAQLRRYGIEPGGRIADPWEPSVQA